jgi:antitoxin VapB
MTKTRTFKSGNSVALRLPKTLGIGPGVEMTVREERGCYVVEPVEPPRRKLDISGFWGKAPWLEPPRRGDFEERPSAAASQHPRGGPEEA